MVYRTPGRVIKMPDNTDRTRIAALNEVYNALGHLDPQDAERVIWAIIELLDLRGFYAAAKED